jgi:dipeptidyl aminopeptidase/acylaminoacyl peptidase
MKKVSRLFLAIWLFLTVLAAAQAQATTPKDVAIGNNKVLLKGKFYVCAGTGPFPTVLLLHGFPGNETDVLGLGSKISEAGLNVLTFNYGGTFQSQGQMNMENAQKDIQAAFDFLHQQDNITSYKIDTARIFLGGFCFGGGMALGYAAGHPEITAVFSIAGNDHGEFFREYARNPELKKMIDDMFAGVAAPAGPVRFAPGALPKEMVEAGLDKLNPIFDLRKSAPCLAQKEILLIGGWDDRQVTIDQFVLPFYRALEKENAKNVKIVAFQDDHYFKNSRPELAVTIIEWLKTILEKWQS